MKLSRDHWTAALALMRHATVHNAKDAYAPLGDVVISAADGRVVIEGHDTQTAMTIRFPCEGALAPTPVGLSSVTKLTKAGKRSKGEEMAISATGAGLRLAIGGRTFEVAVGHADRAPAPAAKTDWSSAEVHKFGTDSMRRALDYCAPAMSADPTREDLSCVHLGDDLAIATDGHRLHAVRDIPSFPSGGVSIPPNVVGALRAALKNAEPAWIMSRKSKGFVQFDAGGVFMDVLITSRIGDARFPPYKAVVPAHDTWFAVSAKPWIDSLVTAQKLTDPARGLLVVAHKECRVEVERLFSEVLPLAWRPESKFTFAANARYLLEGSAGAGDLVRVEFSAGLDPLLIRPNDDCFAVVMPMRV